MTLQRDSRRAADAPTSMVARVALILNSFDHTDTPLHLDQVAGRTGLPRSTAHRILTQLHSVGLLQHLSEGYRLTAASAPAGGVDHSALRGVASPVLERLRADTALAVHLGALRGADVLCLDQISGGSGAAVPMRVAGHTPAHASALGKAMLAQLAPEQVDEIFGEPLRKCTPATIADLPTLHEELARIRSRHGLAYDDQELAVGLSSVAAPIRLPAGELAALSLTGAMPAARLQRMAPFLTRACRGIGERVANRPSASTRGPGAVSITDDMLSRVLRTLSSADDWV
ncbi:IclR family transcriptional regulator [Mycolicibacterium sp. XJ1819]